MRKSSILLLFLLIFTDSFCQKTALELDLKQGAKYLQSMESLAKIQQEIDGKTLNNEMRMSGTTAFTVKEVNDDGYSMEVQYEELAFTIDSPSGPLVFSSEKQDDADILSQILAEMKKTPFQIRMSRTGKVTEIQNIHLLFEAALSKFPQIDSNQRDLLMDQLMKSFGKESFKGNMEMVSAIYPDNPVALGETWDVKTSLRTGGMSGEMATIYRFKGGEAGNHIIEGSSIITTTDKDKYSMINGMPTRFELEGSMISKIKVDEKSGWIVEANFEQDIQGTTFIQDNPSLPGGMEIPIVMKNTMVFSD